MRRPGLFEALGLSLVAAPGAYAGAARTWSIVRSVVYLHLAVALAWIPVTVDLTQRLERFAETQAPQALETFPLLLIQQGRLTTDVPTPYTWNDPSTGAPFLLVDPDGEIGTLEGRPETVLVTSGRLEVRGGGPLSHVDTSGVPAFLIDKQTLEGMLETARTWLAVIFYPLAVAHSVTWRGAQAALGAALAVWLAQRRGIELGPPGGFALGALATTPLLLVEVLGLLLKDSAPWLTLHWLPETALVLAVTALGMRGLSRR